MNQGTLDSFGLWCPFCGKNTIRKEISNCKFILCENFINCDYFKIIECNIIDIGKDDNYLNTSNNNYANYNNKNEGYKENYCIEKLKQFINDEKLAEEKRNKKILKDNKNNKCSENQKGQYGKKFSKRTLRENELGIHKNEEENNINLILNILNENKKEKSKIELFREESRRKKYISNQRRIVKQENRRFEKSKKKEEKRRKNEEKIRKEEFKKEKAILKVFKEKYEILFPNEELSLENINYTHFKKEEIEIGLKEFERKEFLIEKEVKLKKEKERIEELKKMRRRV